MAFVTELEDCRTADKRTGIPEGKRVLGCEQNPPANCIKQLRSALRRRDSIRTRETVSQGPTNVRHRCKLRLEAQKQHPRPWT